MNVDPLSDEFMKNFESFVPYRDECLDVAKAIARYVHDDRFLELVHELFERFLQYFEAPEGLISYNEVAFDNYKFFAHELFLHCAAVFVDERRPDLFNILVENQYYLRRKADFGGEPLVDFTEFRQHLKSLEFRKGKLAPRPLSLVADMIKERTASTGTNFRKVMQIDFLLFLRADLADFSEFNRWWPETLVYLEFDKLGIHFALVSPTFGFRGCDDRRLGPCRGPARAAPPAGAVGRKAGHEPANGGD